MNKFIKFIVIVLANALTFILTFLTIESNNQDHIFFNYTVFFCVFMFSLSFIVFVLMESNTLKGWYFKLFIFHFIILGLLTVTQAYLEKNTKIEINELKEQLKKYR